MRAGTVGAVAAAVLCIASPASGEINFDQLSNCADLAVAVSAVRASSGACSTPRNSVELAVVNGIAPVPGARFCWLETPPTPSLSRFRCIRVAFPQVRHLDCYGPARAADIDDYQAHYAASYAQRQTDYVARASQCSVASGNAARAVRSMFSGPLTSVTRFELGFAVPLKGASGPDGIALHGYGTLDPQVAGEGAKIEFVSIWSN